MKKVILLISMVTLLPFCNDALDGSSCAAQIVFPQKIQHPDLTPCEPYCYCEFVDNILYVYNCIQYKEIKIEIRYNNTLVFFDSIVSTESVSVYDFEGCEDGFYTVQVSAENTTLTTFSFIK